MALVNNWESPVRRFTVDKSSCVTTSSSSVTRVLFVLHFLITKGRWGYLWIILDNVLGDWVSMTGRPPWVGLAAQHVEWREIKEGKEGYWFMSLQRPLQILHIQWGGPDQGRLCSPQWYMHRTAAHSDHWCSQTQALGAAVSLFLPFLPVPETESMTVSVPPSAICSCCRTNADVDWRTVNTLPIKAKHAITQNHAAPFSFLRLPSAGTVHSPFCLFLIIGRYNVAFCCFCIFVPFRD